MMREVDVLICASLIFPVVNFTTVLNSVRLIMVNYGWYWTESEVGDGVKYQRKASQTFEL